MKFGFLDNIPWLKACLNKDAGSSFGSKTMVIDQPPQRANFDLRFWGWSILSILPLAIRSQEKALVPPIINRKGNSLLMFHIASAALQLSLSRQRWFTSYAGASSHSLSIWRRKKEIGKEGGLIATKELKRLQSNPVRLDRFIKLHESRLLKSDLVAVLAELQRQDQVSLSMKGCDAPK